MKTDESFTERQDRLRRGFDRMLKRSERLSEARRKGWSPGDIALVQCSDGNWRTAMCEPHANRADELVWRFPDRVYRDVESSVARPLLVVDAEDRRAADRLSKSLVELMHADGSHEAAADGIHPSIVAAALAELLAPEGPPKPEEPTGLGAVVEDAAGKKWFRMALENQTWPGEVWQEQYDSADRWSQWQDIAVARVLSEGVTA